MARGAEDAVRWAPRNAVDMALLLVAIAIAAFLRFDALGEPSYWLDEILHQQLTTSALQQPWWHWFRALHVEHGGLYYGTQLAARLAGTSETAGRFPAGLLGVATIPLVWLAAQSIRPGGRIAAPTSALILAVSPLHVYYSREARGYSLLMFLTAALILCLLRARSTLVLLLLLTALLYTTAVSAPVVAAALVVSSLALWMERRRWWLISSVAAGVTLMLFRLVYAAQPVESADWPGFPAIDAGFLSTLLRGFSVSALGADGAGRTVVAVSVFALIGAITLARRNATAATVLTGMTLLPLTLTIAALRHYDHFFALRYVTPALIGFVLLAGVGVAAVAEALSRPIGRSAEWAALALAISVAAAIGWQVWPVARTEPFQKLDWRAIASTIWNYAKPGDIVIAAEPWSEVSLRYYLDRLPPRVTLHQFSSSHMAEIHARARPASWLVTAGFSPIAEVREWMCGYPMLMASPLESFRLHYASSGNDFLRERAKPAELRAQAAALGLERATLQMGAGEGSFLGEGWAEAEGPVDGAFRWAIGHRASVTLPRWGVRDRSVRFKALPMDHPSLPRQTVRVSLNGSEIGQLTLAPEWSEHSLPAPAPLWINGLNTLRFDFGRPAPPAGLDPASNDNRPLALAFDSISIVDTGALNPSNPELPADGGLLRIASGPFLDEKTIWRDTPTRFPPERLRRDAVTVLLGRLGLDAETVWPRLIRGELYLDNIAETVAYGEQCEDDLTFLRKTFAVLLGCAPSAQQERELLQQLRSGTSRVRLVGRIVKSGDFRSRVLKLSS